MKGAVASVVDAIWLPTETTDFEVRYLGKVNALATAFFALHLPVLVVVAYFNQTGPRLAAMLTVGVLMGPMTAMRLFRNPRHISMMHGVTAMLMGALLVHFGQGPAQLEMHFYFFALLAMLAIFANPTVVLLAALTVMIHQLAFWYWVPRAVFNDDAPFWVVVVPAIFVILESVATIYVARSFFDNVIGLERIVRSRTAEIDQKNRQMRLVLDNVEQGLLTVDRNGIVADERSAAVERWLGGCPPGGRFVECLRQRHPATADAFEAAFDQLLMDVLPFDVAIDQFPHDMVSEGRHLGLDYIPIAAGGTLEQLLVVITDRTAMVQRAQLETEQRETMALLERSREDQAGFLEFFEEAKVLVRAVTERHCHDVGLLRRTVHTLKGNAMLYEVHSVADICERMETHVSETGSMSAPALNRELADRWERLTDSLRVVLSEGSRDVVELRPEQYRDLLAKALAAPTDEELARMLVELRLEGTSERLTRIGDQARRIAARLGKSLNVHVHDGGLRLDPRRWSAFWQDFVHVVRNAVDHGLEASERRVMLGKPEHGTLTLATALEGDEFVLRVSDDGGGIDWERVRDRARASGVAATTPRDLQAALFHDGLTTRAEASAYSGRGVGLSAVRSACAELGGQISVRSELGSGTTFEFRFPSSSMAPSAQDFLAA